MKKRFRSGVNIHRTRSSPGADIGSDHDLVMMTFHVRLKKTRKPNQPRLRFDLEKLRDPDVACRHFISFFLRTVFVDFVEKKKEKKKKKTIRHTHIYPKYSRGKINVTQKP